MARKPLYKRRTVYILSFYNKEPMSEDSSLCNKLMKLRADNPLCVFNSEMFYFLGIVCSPFAWEEVKEVLQQKQMKVDLMAGHSFSICFFIVGAVLLLGWCMWKMFEIIWRTFQLFGTFAVCESSEVFHFSKSNNTTVKKYSVTKSPAFKILKQKYKSISIKIYLKY